MILPLTGQQYSEKVAENCISFWKEAGVYTEAEAKAVEKFKEIFHHETFPHAASIIFNHSLSGSVSVRALVTVLIKNRKYELDKCLNTDNSLILYLDILRKSLWVSKCDQFMHSYLVLLLLRNNLYISSYHYQERPYICLVYISKSLVLLCEWRIIVIFELNLLYFVMLFFLLIILTVKSKCGTFQVFRV